MGKTKNTIDNSLYFFFVFYIFFVFFTFFVFFIVDILAKKKERVKQTKIWVR